MSLKKHCYFTNCCFIQDLTLLKMFTIKRTVISICHRATVIRYYHKENRLSAMFPIPFGTPKVQNKDNKCKSHLLMQYKNLLLGQSTGTFYIPPFTLRALEKLNGLIEHEMGSIGAQKVALPCLSNIKLWQKSKRVEEIGKELFRLKGNGNIHYCLSPTHEEAISDLMAAVSPLARQAYPVKLYQIGRKFRDEASPKHGLLRCKEFEMKDLYTFDDTEEKASKTYEEVCESYQRIFEALNLPYIKVSASSGAMGGSKSDEFHLPALIGEDQLLSCTKCGECFNAELKDQITSQECEHEFEEIRGIEVGHAFLLGTRYSQTFNAHYTCEESGEKKPLIMGCFGIGTTRLLAASIEVLSSETEIRWPRLIAPYQISIIPQKAGYKDEVTNALADEMYDELNADPLWNGDVLVDDRIKYSIGQRIKWAQDIGLPYLVVAGKQALSDPPLFELIDVYGDEKVLDLTHQQVCEELSRRESMHLDQLEEKLAAI